MVKVKRVKGDWLIKVLNAVPGYLAKAIGAK